MAVTKRKSKSHQPSANAGKALPDGPQKRQILDFCRQFLKKNMGLPYEPADPVYVDIRAEKFPREDLQPLYRCTSWWGKWMSTAPLVIYIGVDRRVELKAQSSQSWKDLLMNCCSWSNSAKDLPVQVLHQGNVVAFHGYTKHCWLPSTTKNRRVLRVDCHMLPRAERPYELMDD